MIWVFIADVFPNAVRAKEQAPGSLTHRVMGCVTHRVLAAIVS